MKLLRSQDIGYVVLIWYMVLYNVQGMGNKDINLSVLLDLRSAISMVVRSAYHSTRAH